MTPQTWEGWLMLYNYVVMLSQHTPDPERKLELIELSNWMSNRIAENELKKWYPALPFD